MFEVKSEYKKYEIKTDDSWVIVLLESGIKYRIELLEELIADDLFTYNKQEYIKEIEKLKSYLKQL